MRPLKYSIPGFFALLLTAVLAVFAVAPLSRGETSSERKGAPEASARSSLTAEQWHTLDATVDKALAFLATRQRADGSFEAPNQAQPGVTSLCVMAFLARGHVPHQGMYGAHID